MAPVPPGLVGLGNMSQVNFTTRCLKGLAVHRSTPLMVSLLSKLHQPDHLPDVFYLLQMPQTVQESVALCRGQQILRQGAKLRLNFLVAHGVLVMATMVRDLSSIVLTRSRRDIDNTQHA